MNKLFIISLLWICSFCSVIYGQNCRNTNDQKAYDSFQKVESAMQKYSDYFEKRRIFEDPVDRIYYYFQTIQKIAPDLLCNTFQYKDELLSILSDNALKKNYWTYTETAYLLYNTTIDEYVEILNSVFNMYKQKIIDFQQFRIFLFQDSNVSNSVAKNYQNKGLILFFDTLLQDTEWMNLSSGQDELFKESIIELKNGKAWNGSEGDFFRLKEDDKNHPPILDTLKIKCDSLQAQNSCNSTLCLFQKVENKMQMHYKTNRMFEDLGSP